MKKFIFVFFAFMMVFCKVDAQNSCPVYGTNGAIATLVEKGEQTNMNGTLFVHVNVKNNTSSKPIVVWVEIRDQNTRCVVKRVKVNINRQGDGVARVDGLLPNHDYLFNIDSAKSCDE